MGSNSSRQGTRPSRSPKLNRFKRTLSSLFFCGASTSHASLETGDYPLLNSTNNSDPAVHDFSSALKESGLTSNEIIGVSSESNRRSASKDLFSEEGVSKVDVCKKEKSLSNIKELVPSQQLNGNSRYADSASTSYEDRLFPDPSCFNSVTNPDTSQISSDVVNLISNSPSEDPGDALLDGASVENHASELSAIHSDSGSDSPVSFHSSSNDPAQEVVPSGLGFLVSDREQLQRGESMLHVDVVGISSNTLPSSSSSSTAEASSREARRNSRRLFWDAFSRRSSRRHSDSRTLLFSTDDFDDLGSHDRWLLDFGGDFFDDGFGGNNSGRFDSRTHRTNDRRLHPRSEFRERLRGGFDGRNRQTSICPSGLHPNGTCTCESILMAEESSTRASISRIVMLAEALFEVLDEIHRQPTSLSLSMVSLPAPDSVVDSFPVKSHEKTDTTESGDDIPQCYICLAEYEEGDQIRVLPCKHEYHMACVDKWLKEIHGICPLCRGDVREGFPEGGSVPNSEVSSV